MGREIERRLVHRDVSAGERNLGGLYRALEVRGENYGDAVLAPALAQLPCLLLAGHG